MIHHDNREVHGPVGQSLSLSERVETLRGVSAERDHETRVRPIILDREYYQGPWIETALWHDSISRGNQ